MSAWILAFALLSQTATSTVPSAKDLELARYLTVLENLELLQSLDVLEMLPLFEEDEGHD